MQPEEARYDRGAGSVWYMSEHVCCGAPSREPAHYRPLVTKTQEGRE